MSVVSLISMLNSSYAADTRLVDFISVASLQTSRDRFGDNYEYAVALRVCHMIYRNPSGTPGNPAAVTSASEGGVSQSYSVPAGLAKKYGDLCSSPYGMQLADLIEGNIFAPTTAAGGSNTALLQGNSL